MATRGHPWFIGTGIGFDINRILVYERGEQDAVEAAEEKWPERMGTKVPKRSEESGDFFAKGHEWRSKEIRICQIAERVEKGHPLIGGDAKLTTGEVIRYK